MEPNQRGKIQKTPGRYQRQVQHYYIANHRRVYQGLGSQQIRASQHLRTSMQFRASHQIRASIITPIQGVFAGPPYQRLYFRPGHHSRLCHLPILPETLSRSAAVGGNRLLNPTRTRLPENNAFGPQPPMTIQDAGGSPLFRPAFGCRPAIPLRGHAGTQSSMPSEDRGAYEYPQAQGPQPVVVPEVMGDQYPPILGSQLATNIPSLHPFSQPGSFMMNPQSSFPPDTHYPSNPDCGTDNNLQMLCNPPVPLPGGSQYNMIFPDTIQGSQYPQTQDSQPHPVGFAGFSMGNQPDSGNYTCSEAPSAISSNITGASGHQWLGHDVGMFPRSHQHHLLQNLPSEMTNTIPTTEACKERADYNMETNHPAKTLSPDHTLVAAHTSHQNYIPHKEVLHCAVSPPKSCAPCAMNPNYKSSKKPSMNPVTDHPESNPATPCEVSEENVSSPNPSTSTEETEDYVESPNSASASVEENDRTVNSNTESVDIESVEVETAGGSFKTPESMVKLDHASANTRDITFSSGATGRSKDTPVSPDPATTSVETENATVSPNSANACVEAEDCVGSSNTATSCEETETQCERAEEPVVDSPGTEKGTPKTEPTAPLALPLSSDLGFSMVGVYRSGALSHPGILTEDEEAKIRSKKQNMDSLIKDMQKIFKERIFLLNPLHTNDIERISQDYIMYCHNELKRLEAKESANAMGNREYVQRLKHELRVLMADKEKILDASSVDCELLDYLNKKEQSLHDELAAQDNLSYNLHIAAEKIRKEILEIEKRKVQLSMMFHNILTLKEICVKADVKTNEDMNTIAAQTNPAGTDMNPPAQ